MMREENVRRFALPKVWLCLGWRTGGENGGKRRLI